MKIVPEMCVAGKDSNAYNEVENQDELESEPAAEIQLLKTPLKDYETIVSETQEHAESMVVNKNKDVVLGVIAEDCRGHHGNTGRSLDQADKDGSREDINSYPRKEYHYCRASSSNEYLGGDLHLTVMYRQYKEWCHQKNKTIIKQGTYEHIFRNEFNIAFNKPKKDQRLLCLSSQNAVGEDKLRLTHAHNQHLKERDLCRLEKKQT
ncbi:unnamed protein product [Arctia plantaginis]|uniref:Uncharacterized protein n=1 Tax=Arctia plantaginis TaxID=874455 RepID=A0A8S0ZFT7_ARCPL|nr:unnamed protein product [Arctia plantaginis]